MTARIPPSRRAELATPTGKPGGAAPRLADPVANWRENITSRVGPRQSPGGVGSTNHKGIDVGVPTGTPVQSVKDGKVLFAGDAGGYGNLVVVQHGDGTVTKYAHLHEINIQAGQEVQAGQVIGKVGNTGHSTGPHLHFEVRKGGENGAVLDPEAYLAGSEAIAAVDPGPGNSYAGTGGGGSTLSLGGGNGTPSGMSLSGGGGGGGGAPVGGASAGTPVVSGGAPVAKGDFGALLAKLKAMGIDEAFLKMLSEKYGVPIEVMLGVMMQESGGDPNAGSHAGAQGLMQLMPGTAKELGVTNPLDPKQNLEGGVKYLAQMFKNPRSGGNWTTAFGMYNAGPAGNFNNPETRGYMQSVPQLVAQARAALTQGGTAAPTA